MGYNELDFDTYPVIYQQLIKQQNKSWWEQVFCGCFSKEWARLQQGFLEDYVCKQDTYMPSIDGGSDNSTLVRMVSDLGGSQLSSPWT